MGMMRRRWYLVAPVVAIWTLAYIRLFIDPTPRVPLLFNWTPSLPYHVGWMHVGARTPGRGDLIVFAFSGGTPKPFPGLQGQPFFKRVRGLPGDVITVQGRTVLVNGEPMGLAKPFTHDRRPLTPIAPLVIPPGQFYVQGASADSFDSRYQESGLVAQGQIVARVHPLF
nr:conjugative transfer signal peptidase TraF [uncultured Roseateles sp.]